MNFYQPLLIAIGLAGNCMAALIVSDDFGDTTHPGNLPGTAVSPGIRFDIPSGVSFAGAVTIPNNATFGRVLALDDSDTTAGTTTAAVGALPGSVLLANTGDSVTISLKFRFTTTTANNTFRMGLFNSMGTGATGTGSDNDIGYYVNIPASGTATNLLFFRENSGTAPAMGGADRTNYPSNTALAALPAAGASDLYNLSLTLVKTSGGINFSLSLALGANAPATYTASATTSLITSFDEVMFSTAFNEGAGTHIIVDDLTVDATNFIPEPSAAALAMLGALAGLSRRSRRQA